MQRLNHVLDIDRFGQEPIHARLLGGPAILVKGIGGHGQNGNARQCRVLQRTDAAGGLVTVHNGHLNVHQYQIIGSGAGFGDFFHRLRTVFGGVQREAVFLENFHRNFPVQLVVLHQQQVFALKVLRVLRAGQNMLPTALFLAQRGEQTFPQVGHEHGLGTEGGDARGAGLHLNVRPVVGSEDDDGGIVPQTANLPGHLDAVHIGQTPVNDVGMESIVQLHGLSGPQHRFFAGERPLGAHPHLDQHFGDAVAGVEVIVHHQRFQPLQLGDGIHHTARGLQAQRQDNDKLGALVLFGMYRDGAAHHVDDVFGDGHAQTGALNAADRGGALPFKGFKDALGKFGAHTDTGILDPDFVLPHALRCAVNLPHPHRHRPAGGRELDGVGQQIEHDLIEAGLIAVDVLLGDIRGVHVQLQLLGVNLSADDGLDVMQHIGQVGFLLLQLDAAAFDSAHIQHIVDEGQQMVAGGQNLGQIFPHLVGVFHIGHRQRGKADDGVHGGADVVRHIGQESTLGSVGALGRLHRILQILIDFAFLGAVGHHNDVFFLFLNVPAQGGHVEPAHLAGLLVDIFPVPLGLPAGGDGGQLIQHQHGVLAFHQTVHRMDVGAGVLLRDAHQLFDVGAEVVHMEAIGVQHDEDVVHVAGQD